MSNEIVVKDLKFPENVRKRLGMYLGSSDDPTKAGSEVVDNSLDEILEGHADKCHVYQTERSFMCIDTGRGVPVYEKFEQRLKAGYTMADVVAGQESEFFEMVPTGWTAARSVWGSLHSGGKFDDADKGTVVGMNGVGASCANATSAKFIGMVNLNKKNLTDPKHPTHQWIIDDADQLENPVYVIEFSKGYFTSEKVVDVSEIEPPMKDAIEKAGSNWGTLVYFEPDPTIWDSVETKFSRKLLRVARMTIADNVEILVDGEEVDPFDVQKWFDKTEFIERTAFQVEGNCSSEEATVKYKIQFGFSGMDFDYRSHGSVNTITTPDGVHVRSTQRGIGKALASINKAVNPGDARYSLRAFTLLLTNRAMFNSQTKENLTKIEHYNARWLEESICDSILTAARKDKNMMRILKLVCERIIEYKKQMGNMSMKQQVEAEIRTSANSKASNGLGTKVWDCSSKNRSECELFIVEGDSAAGSLVQSRDTKKHAILPLT